MQKRIDEAFDCIKAVGGPPKAMFIDKAKFKGQAMLCFAAPNLMRLGSVGG